MADDFSYTTWFSLDAEHQWFQMHVWMPGGYVPGMKREIKNWHDHANLIVDIRKEGAMTVKVPLKTSAGEDNFDGGRKLMKYRDDGKGSCLVKFKTVNHRSDHQQKLLFSNLEVFGPIRNGTSSRSAARSQTSRSRRRRSPSRRRRSSSSRESPRARFVRAGLCKAPASHPQTITSSLGGECRVETQV